VIRTEDNPPDTNKKPISATRQIHCAFIAILWVDSWDVRSPRPATSWKE
jgi:hypothetical protein